MFFKNKGFTLIELLVVMAILGVLMVVSLANFRTSQIKSRDAQRKSDLRQIANGLDVYMADHSFYPSSSGGRIKACGCKSAATADACEWSGTGSRELCDESNTVYMKVVPGDPVSSQTYCYWSDGNMFRVYARLENTNDPSLLPADAIGSCGGTYNFGISSANTKP